MFALDSRHGSVKATLMIPEGKRVLCSRKHYYLLRLPIGRFRVARKISARSRESGVPGLDVDEPSAPMLLSVSRRNDQNNRSREMKTASFFLFIYSWGDGAHIGKLRQTATPFLRCVQLVLRSLVSFPCFSVNYRSTSASSGAKIKS